MRIILFIFALSMFLASCQEETIPEVRCGRMTFSDALPIQFWLAECETYNEHEAPGVHHACWCQPWNCDDEINIQFQDIAGQSFLLLAKKNGDVYNYSQAFLEIDPGVYQTSFTPDLANFCDDTIQLLITGTIGVILPAPIGWTDIGTAFTTKTATEFNVTDTVSTTRSAYYILSQSPGEVLDFKFLVDYISGTTTLISVFIYFTDSSNLQVGIAGFVIDPLDRAMQTVSATIPVGATRVLIEAQNGSAPYNYNIELYHTDGVTRAPILDVTNEDILAKSDCLDIAESHDETILMEYSNHRNFDGLIYENQSPDVSFNIRVPCRFIHEIEPEEDEAMELTSSIVTTSSQVKTQRLLEVQHAPYYFHKKLRRILKHKFITIFDKEWEKEEKYEIVEGKKTWPLKAATCYLTEKNSVVRNVL